MSDTEQDYHIFDLIQYVNDGKPLDFEKAFSKIVQAKIAAAVEEKSQSVANQFFGGTTPPEDPDDEYYDEEDEDDEDSDGEQDA